MYNKITRLIDIHNRKTRVVLGLMSGTSHDGIDVAIAKISNGRSKTDISLLCHDSFPYPDELKKKIGKAFNGNTEEICRLNFELGNAFAEAALIAIKRGGLKREDIDIIASHGQTIYHVPPENNEAGSTLQIGEASVIAERTGVLTVSDFRTMDMAAGGHGAPLVPLADYILFHEKGRVSAVQNIGGIANVSVIPEDMDDVFAFDTGPGNSLMDESVKILTRNEMAYDIDGRMASSGSVDDILLKELMEHPYLKAAPPKSTGRELFGNGMASLLVEAGIRKNRRAEDIVSTLTRFTAESVYDAYERFIFPEYTPHRVILCGGGCRNPVLVGHLRELFARKGTSRPEVVMIDDLGIPSSAKEALSFAILGNETVSGRAGNIPKATGAKKGVVLGKISL